MQKKKPLGRGGVDAFRPKCRGFDSRSSHHVGTFGKFLTFTPLESFPSGQFWGIYALIGEVRVNSQLPMALRREIPAQYPCCVRSASE